MNKIILIFIFFLFFLIFPKETLAMSFEISNITPTIVNSITQEVQISLTSISISAGSYLRVSFQKNDGDSYFGEMSQDKNGWTPIRSTTSGDCSGYYLVSSGVTSVDLYLKIGNNNPLNGDYKAKVNRFTAGCNLDSNTKMESVVTISLPTSTPSPTPTPTTTATATPTVAPTPTPTLSKAIYTIGKPKDVDGNYLTSVQIYVDGNYIHHEDNEILEFYQDHECYSGISCNLSTHTISLRKDGYNNWEDAREFTAGMNLEVVPILTKLVTPSPTPTPTKTPTPFASPKPTAQAGTPTPTNSPTEEVLGVTTMFPSATPIKTDEPIKVSQNSFPFFAVGLIILGLGFVGFSISIIMKNVKREGS